MDRKLTEKEIAFLTELRELMAKHSAMLSVENGRVCIDIEYSEGGGKEPIVLPEAITVFFDLDEVILVNS